MHRKIILASTSPRRKEILSRLKIKFSVMDGGYEENMKLKMSPIKLAQFLALGKAQAVANKEKNSIVIAADTFVICGKQIMGKPHTAKKAKKMLAQISGKTVSMVTGIAVIDTVNNKIFSDFDLGKVKIKKISKAEIDSYVATGEPLKRAAAFAVEGLGGIFIEKISGDYNSMVGISLFKIAGILQKLGVKIF